jgi:hypothetical protein
MKHQIFLAAFTMLAVSACIQPGRDVVRAIPTVPSSPATPIPPASTAPFACRAFGDQPAPVNFNYPTTVGGVTRFEGIRRMFRAELENFDGRIQLTVWYREAVVEPYLRFVWPDPYLPQQVIDFAFANHVVVGGDHPSAGDQWNIRCDHADLLPATLPPHLTGQD